MQPIIIGATIATTITIATINFTNMDNYIQTLNAGLARMKELMRCLLPNPSDFEDILSLYKLYKEYNHTDSIIDYAKAVIDSDEGFDQLLADVGELNQLVTDCIQLYRTHQQAFDSIDSHSIFEAHIKPFHDAEKAEADLATPFWKEYQQLSNRLDYLDNDSAEFKELEPKCGAVKAEYDIHHAKINELHRIYNDEVKRCAVALSFTLEDLAVLFFYMQRISQTIIDTITKPQGEQTWQN